MYLVALNLVLGLFSFIFEYKCFGSYKISVLHTNNSTIQNITINNSSIATIHSSKPLSFKTLNDKKKLCRYYSTEKLSKKYKEECELTPEQKEIIIGVILGDGCLEKLNIRSNTRLKIDNAYPDQEKFVYTLRKFFDSITNMEPKILTRTDKRSNKTSQSISFSTLTLPCLNYYHELFYKNKKKSIPSNIEELLTERGLAFWLMGDGLYRKDRGGVIICTDSFVLEDTKLLTAVLINKFELSASTSKHKDNVYRIYIHKKSVDKLIGLVKPYFISTMEYKLGWGVRSSPTKNINNYWAQPTNLIDFNSLIWLNLYKWKYFYKNIINIRNTSNNKDNVSLIIGSLLGNSYMEKNEKGVRIVFIKCSDNIEYLMKFYNCLSNTGYCKSKKPVLNKVISKKNKVFYYYKIESHYLTQFVWFYELFYRNNVKTIPLNLKEYLTPLSLTTWYLDNTEKVYLSDNQGFYLNNNDLECISQILKNKYYINTAYRLESKGKVAFYIENETLNNFSNLIKPHISSPLQSKLNDPYNKVVIWSFLKKN